MNGGGKDWGNGKTALSSVAEKSEGALDRINDQLENVVKRQASLARSMEDIMAMQVAIKHSLQRLETQPPGLGENTATRSDLAEHDQKVARPSDTESTPIASASQTSDPVSKKDSDDSWEKGI